MERELPFVTAIIVVKNEEKYIKPAILSFLNQDYPKDKYELLIVDGMSTDNTMAIAKETVRDYGKEHNNIEVHYLDNPKQLLAAGWNLGIKAAKGKYVVRIDAHAQADSCLISKCVEILSEKTDVVCVGGRLETCPLTEKGQLISDVLSSPFGVGNSKFRYAEKSGYVDTAAYGMYRKEIFDKAGYFNEEFMRNQDNDMHGRIKSCGGKFYLDTSIKSLYHSRETFKGMTKQAYGNGKWTIIGIRKSESKEGISLRHLIPLLFLIANIVLMMFGIVFQPVRYIFLAMYIMYFLLAIYFASKKTKSFIKIVKMCGYYWCLHISYGWGSLREIFHIKEQKG